MKTVNLYYAECPNCKTEVRRGAIRCFACGTWLFWKVQGNTVTVEKRTSSVNWPKDGFVHFRRGTTRVVLRKEADDGSEQIGLLAQEQQVKIVADQGDFYQLEDGNWVRYNCIEIRMPISERSSPKKLVMVNDHYSGWCGDSGIWPGSNPVWYELEPGTVVAVFEETTTHYRIGDGVWIDKFFVEHSVILKFMMSGESKLNEAVIPPPRPPTEYRAHILGKDVVVTSPIWIPDKLKNYVVEKMIARFQKVFPTVDFSRVSGKDLDKLGIQSAIVDNPNIDTSEYEQQSGVAIYEALTQIVSTYAYRVDKRLPVHIDDLIHAGIGYEGGMVGKVTENLISASRQYFIKESIAQGKYDEQWVVANIMKLFGEGYFSGNLEEIKRIYTEGTKLSMGYPSFEELMSEPVSKPEEQLKQMKQGIKSWLTIRGCYDEMQNSSKLVLSIFGEAISRVGIGTLQAERTLVDIINRLSSNSFIGLKQRIDAYIQILKIPATHETAHFLSFQMWKKRGYEKLDPALLKIVDMAQKG